MNVKIDENLARAHRRILEAAGHDVADVHDERLAGASDDVLWSHVCAEGRFLVTLDADFSDVRMFGCSLRGPIRASSWCARLMPASQLSR